MDNTIPPNTLPLSPLANAPKVAAAAQAGDIDQHIAQRLKTLRSQGGLTLQDLASRSGVSRAMISKIERAEASATAALLHKLCVALETSLSDLLVPHSACAGKTLPQALYVKLSHLACLRPK
jgi:transcriptional regulator with XRE-family HTH domain